jgi:hypothetical protein
MKKVLGLLAAGFLALPLLMTTPQTASADVVSELIGKNWTVTGRVNGTVVYNPDGTARWRNRWGLSGGGKWRKKSASQLCVAWDAFQGGREGCFTVSKVGPNRFDTSMGMTLSR